MDDSSKSAQNNPLLKSRILWHHLNQVHLCVLKQFAFGPVLCCSCRHHPRGASVGSLSNGTHARCQDGPQTPSRPQLLALQPCPLASSPHSHSGAFQKGVWSGTRTAASDAGRAEEGTSAKGGHGPRQALSFQKDTWTASIPCTGMVVGVAAFLAYHFLLEGREMARATVFIFPPSKACLAQGSRGPGPWL